MLAFHLHLQCSAYLNYVFFDQDFNFISGSSNYKQISTAAEDAHELLEFNGLVMPEAGYLFIYVSNEGHTSTGGNVYFDDLRIAHKNGPIIQEDHYYPFGMSINALSSSAPLSTPNRFKYNGKEFQPDFDIGWYDYGARMYMPDIGRWSSIDPLADAYYNVSPYTYVANNPIKYLDPDGNVIVDKDGNIVVTTTGRTVSVAPEQMSETRKNSNGTQSATFIQRTYEVVNIFADNGTPIEAFILVSADQIEATFDAKGNLIGSTTSGVDNSKYDCTADCHGLTFASNRLWISDNQVDKLLENENVWRDVTETAATGVVFKNDGSIVHSALRNSDGTFDDNAGVQRTERNRSLSESSRGLTDTSKKGNTEFFLHMGNTILNTTLGSVKNGVRTISSKKDIEKLFEQINQK